MGKSLELGWREWCSLPELGIPAIKAKVDTGAKTSALHTFGIEPYTENGRPFVRFYVHPLQKNKKVSCECTAPVADEREVSDSGGHREMRYIIETQVRIGEELRRIEMSLTNRDTMRFRMLLGRTAMAGDVAVFPERSYINGRLRARKLYGLEKKK
ncbi:MAG TPA: ATP-dependent zinc protease [Tichowtungia sp.]|nr:ATP-dependent zinc protease [Tichowtungia sp.]